MSEPLQQYLTVHALTEYIKRKFDYDPHLQQVYVVGEISNFRKKSRHQYFSLKDEQAKINAVMFWSDFKKVKFDIEDGMKVLVSGYISVYKETGQYQIYVSSMEPDGIGSLYLAFEQLKKKFKEAGLFDLPKKALPKFPRKIAVITSRSGAVIHDIHTTLSRRNPIVGYELFETKVQGTEAPKEIVEQFKRVKARQEEFDLIILARGGGSIEDLWCFNDENVAKAIIESDLPVISSIGHETDTTLADLVADVRAATPTAAAELAVPVLLEIKDKLYQLERDLNIMINQEIELLTHQLDSLKNANIFSQPQRIIENPIQNLDQKNEQLNSYFDFFFRSLVQKFVNNQSQIHVNRLADSLRQKTKELDFHKQSLANHILQYQENKLNRVHHLDQLLEAYNPLSLMKKGYSIVMKENVIISSVKDISQNDSLRLHLQDGYVDAKVSFVEEVTEFNQQE